MIQLIAFCDGGYNNVSKSNGYGSFRIFSETDDIIIRKEFDTIKSSNEAEYQTLIELLRFIKANLPEELSIKIYSDSMLMVNQMNKVWRVKSDSLILFNGVATNLFTSFDNISLEWIPRKIIVKQLGH